MCLQSDCFCVKLREIISVLCPGCFTEFGHKCMCTNTHTSYQQIVLYIGICVVCDVCYMICVFVCVYVCVCTCVHVCITFCSHSSSCPEQSYSLRQYGSEPASGDKNRNTAAMDFPKVKTFPLQMRGVSSFAMQARRSCLIQNTSIISNIWQANIMAPI